jgi:drug/metabolite transporter (DMT)-like permease
MFARIGSTIASPERRRALDFLRGGDVILLVAAVFWALNLSVGKYALSHGFSPLAYAGPRNAIAGVVFLIAAFRRGETMRLQRTDLRMIPLAALLGVMIDQLAFIYGLHDAQATVVGLVFGAGPVVTALIAFAVGAERLTRRGWISAALSTAGVALVALGAGSPLGGDARGAALAMLSTVAFAAYGVVLMPLVKRHSVLFLSGLVNLTAAVPILIVSVPSFTHEAWSQISLSAWLAWGYGLTFSYILGNFLWMAGLQAVGASRAALYSNAQPFLGAAFAVVLLSERLSVIQGAGGVIVLAGLFLAGRTFAVPVQE